jgi:hypothetical protein
MLVVGLAAAVRWQSLYPDARDLAVLGPLPVPAPTVFLARASAVFLFLALFAFAANGIMSVTYPLVVNVRPQPGSSGFVRSIVAHVTATFSAAAFTALVTLSAPAALQAMLPARWFRGLAPLVQLGSVLVLVLSSLFVPFLLSALDPQQQGVAAEQVALHRLYSVDGEGRLDWVSPPPGSAFEPDPERGGMRPRAGAERPRYRREVEAFPGQPLDNAVAGSAGTSQTGSWTRWCPPVWFLGWYEVLVGRRSAAAATLAKRAQGALLLATGGFFVLYAVAYRRQARAAGVARAAGPGLVRRLARAAAARLLARLLPSPVSRAAFTFTVKTLARSTRHRLVVTAAVGVGLALALADLCAALVGTKPAIVTGVSTATVLAVQPVLVGLALLGVRVAFALPSSLAANWVFRFHGPAMVREYAAGARMAALLTGVLWPIALLAPLHVPLLGWATTVTHAACGFLASLSVIELLLAKFSSVPCTRSHVPGKARLRSRLLLYVLLFHLTVSALVAVENWAMARPIRIAFILLLLIGLYMAIARWRRRQQQNLRLLFEEASPDTTQTLGLAGSPTYPAAALEGKVPSISVARQA